jgi:hypothetical protein
MIKPKSDELTRRVTCMRVRREVYNIFFRNLRRRDLLEEFGIDGRVILKWISENYRPDIPDKDETQTQTRRLRRGSSEEGSREGPMKKTPEGQMKTQVEGPVKKTSEGQMTKTLVEGPVKEIPEGQVMKTPVESRVKKTDPSSVREDAP